MSRENTVTVTSLSPSGDGLCELDGRWIKVTGALPGERVRVHRERRDKVFSVASREESSPDRVIARCPIVEACGGCAWQHASRELQQKTRIEQLRRALPPNLRETPVLSEPSPLAYGYRTRARMSWRALRGSVVLGFRARGTTDLVDVLSCAVLDPRLDDALPVLRAVLSSLGARGEVSLGLGLRGAAVASLRPESGLSALGYGVPETLVSKGFVGVSLWTPGATVALTVGDPRPVLRGADGEDLVLAPDGFAQANEALNQSLVEHVLGEAIGASRSVIELFAGAGNFTVMLARDAQKVTAVESDHAAARALSDNLAARGLFRCVVREGLAERVFPEIKGEVVVLDPPREGAREVCTMLLERKLRRVVYVSCDPGTLGRDLGLLSARYEVLKLRVFEMFPQTPHLEVVATLGPKGAHRPGAV